MKPINRTILAAACLLAALAPSTDAAHWTAGMKSGTAELKSAGPIAFGPEGILLVADTKSAAILAIDTADNQPAGDSKPVKIEGLNQKLAGLLGTSADELAVNDLAVNPISHNIYLAVSRGRGTGATPVLVRAKTDGKLEVVTLENVKLSRAELPDAPVDGVVGGGRPSNPRMESITDIAFFEDRVLIAGLSNEEFSSTFRAIPFPFKTVANGTSVEIYHGAHGQFETRSPVRTFVPFNVGSEPHLLAAYTCTPLVQFPIKSLTPGAKIKGKTIAELGNRNRPLDMIVYQKDGKDYLLLANNSRGVMKISTDHIEQAENIQEPVKGGGAKGLNYETIAGLTGVEQLDRLDNKNAVVLRNQNGALTLESLPLP
jgi:hypothetical protein